MSVKVSDGSHLADNAAVTFDEARGVPAVYPATPTDGWWSEGGGSNQVGIEQPFAAGANNRQTILKFPQRGPPQVWTVTLGLDRPASVSIPNTFEITAVLQFGCGGVTQIARMDWIEGASITVPMNAINVIAEYGLDFDAPVGLVLRVNIAVGTARSEQPQKTESIAVTSTIPSLSAPLAEIPRFAKSLVLIPRFPADAPTFFAGGAGVSEISFFQDIDGLFRTGGTTGDTVGLYPQGVPIPNGSRFFHVLGPFGPVGSPFQALFPLAL